MTVGSGHQHAEAVQIEDFQSSDIADRRLNGVYYTSDYVADAVAGWAVARGANRLLDPSFGGCSFLRVALHRLQRRGLYSPGASIFGIDKDAKARKYAGELIQLGVPRENLRIRDFLNVEPDEFGSPFDAVVGNPPYVRHHLLTEPIIDQGQDRATRVGISLNRRADLWAYFVAHALSFTAQGGRLAMLLPGSALQADYASPLLARLEEVSDFVRIVEVRERLFRDAVEKTVILLADGVWAGMSRAVKHYEVQSPKELGRLLRGLSQVRNHTVETNAESPRPSADLGRGARWLESRPRELLSELMASKAVTQLGDLARVRLGIVTGANRFFVLRPQDCDGWDLNEIDLIPVVSRSSWLQTATWRKSDHNRVAGENKACQLLVVPPRTAPTFLRQKIREAERDGVSRRHHCRKRTYWYALDDVDSPDAFLPYMGAQPPRIIANRAGAVCTNAIHRIDWHRRIVGSRAAAGSWTTLFALSAELHGRSYGGGVLKVELRDASRLCLPLPETSLDLSAIDAVARSKGRDAATAAADRLILREGLGLTVKEVRLLSEAREGLALRRHPDAGTIA